MDTLLGTIEDAITANLKTIQGQVAGDYTYKTFTGQVELYDKVVADAINSSLDNVNVVDYILEQDGGERNDEWGQGQNILTNTVNYMITASPITNPQSSPVPQPLSVLAFSQKNLRTKKATASATAVKTKIF